MAEFKTALQWLEWWRGHEGGSMRELWYGSRGQVIDNRRQAWDSFLTELRDVSGPNERWRLIRVPGRINLLGTHIDHRGGTVNYIAFDRELMAAVKPRTDGMVSGCNLDPEFEPFSFSIAERMPRPGKGSWLEYLDSVVLRQGHWSNYLAASILLMQHQFPDRRLGGMDWFVSSDLPRSAGVSSSSSLVVASLLAVCALEGIELSDEKRTEYAGEAEWYVGTRGGMGDHAAMLLSRRSEILSVDFLPLQWRHFTLPGQARVILAHSGQSAQKSEGAKYVFNQRVASYELGMIWLRELHPELCDRLRLIRDLHPERLGITLERLYALIAELPVEADADTIESHIHHQREELRRIWNFYGRNQEAYPLREVVLYGAAECARGRVFGKYLSAGDLSNAGRLISISHDGDRVTREKKPYRSPFQDETLHRLAQSAARNDPDAALELQPGGYRCSTSVLDGMVDSVIDLDGVYGAGLTGAGLGGCIVVLCNETAVGTALAALRKNTENITPEQLRVCASTAGACLV